MANESITQCPNGTSISIGTLTQVFTSSPRNTSRKLSDFYFGGSFLRRNECTNLIDANGRSVRWRYSGVPTSGSIKLTHFWGKAYYYAPPNPINADGRDFYSMGDAEALSIKSRGLAPAFFTLNNNSNRYSSSTAAYAYRLNQDSSNLDSTVVFNNNASIRGRGGRGGNGNGGNGQDGGPGLRVNAPAFFRNNSQIFGGGRGGNAGDSRTGTYNECYCCRSTRWSVGGNGGGGGAGAGDAGRGGNSPWGNYSCDGRDGRPGDWNGPGGSNSPRCCGSTRGSICTTNGQDGRGFGNNGTGVVYSSSKGFTNLGTGDVRGGFAVG